MKQSGIIALSALLFATTSLSAFAEGPQQDHDNQQQQVKRPPQSNQQHGQPQGGQHGQPQGGQHGQPQGGQHGQPQGGQHGQPQGGQHGAQPQNASEHRPPQQHQQFHQGRPLPQKYRSEGYQVNDWHERGLKAPPDGHRWQNVDGNYVMIAVATGVITSIISHQ